MDTQSAGWLRVRVDLADLYREAGRVKDAGAIDAELLKPLLAADPDHPLLMRLEARHRNDRPPSPPTCTSAMIA